MKPNIDLTQNRDFAYRITKEKLTNQIDKYFGQKYPWDLTCKEYLSNNNNIELIFTGSKNTRGRKRKSYLFHIEMQNICDRCGVPINKFPWHKQIGLCDKCDLEVKTDIKGINFKKPWIKTKKIYEE